MDEATWLTGASPWEMLVHLRGQQSERKRRLFACACCRRLWPYFADTRSQTAIEITERFVDGQATRDDLHEAFKKASSAADWNNPAHAGRAAAAACWPDWAIVAEGASISHKATEIAQAHYTERNKRLEVDQMQADLLREI